MNYLWCDLWEYRKDDLLNMNSSQLAKVLQFTQQFWSTYTNWRKNSTDEEISILLRGLPFDDVSLMKKIIEAALVLT